MLEIIVHYSNEIINLNIYDADKYKWVTEINGYPMATAEEISPEFKTQYEKGLLSEWTFF